MLPNLASIYADKTTLEIISDTDALVATDCTRLFGNVGSEIVKRSADGVRGFFLDFNGDWDNLAFQATMRKWIA